MSLYVPQFSKPSKDVGAESLYQNPNAAPNPAVSGIWQAREKEQTEKQFVPYRFNPLGYIRDKLGWEPWQGTGHKEPGQIEVIEAYNLALRQLHERRDFENGLIGEDDLLYWQPGQVIKNIIRIEAGHTVGKTKLASGIFSHFFDCFPPAIIYSYAPSWDQIKSLLWKEIGTDRKGKNLPGRLLEDCEIKTDQANYFAQGRATDNSGGKGTERAQGQHGEYLMFIGDEAEGIADFVFDAIDSMASGGIAIIILLANPRTRTSKFHKIRTRPNCANFRISCVNHPNVRAGREVVPGAVKRLYVETMVSEHSDVVHHHEPDEHTFVLPFDITKNDVLLPAGTIFRPDAECCFRVLGIAPANNSDDTMIPVGRYEAAVNRVVPLVDDDPTKARIGVDVARWGNDGGTEWIRNAGRVWRGAQITKKDTNAYYHQIKFDALKLPAIVTSLHIRVDGGGGFGSGVIDQLKKDDELKQRFPDFKVLEVHNNGVPRDDKAFKNLGTEMYYHAGEALKGVCVVNPPDTLEEDLCERKFDWVNVKGRDVKILNPKEEFKKEHKGRSPDDGDGFALCTAPDFIFVKKGDGKTKPVNPLEMAYSHNRA